MKRMYIFMMLFSCVVNKSADVNELKSESQFDKAYNEINAISVVNDHYQKKEATNFVKSWEQCLDDNTQKIPVVLQSSGVSNTVYMKEFNFDNYIKSVKRSLTAFIKSLQACEDFSKAGGDTLTDIRMDQRLFLKKFRKIIQNINDTAQPMVDQELAKEIKNRGTVIENTKDFLLEDHPYATAVVVTAAAAGIGYYTFLKS